MARPPLPPPVPPSPEIQHIVRPGETLVAIGRIYGVSWETLAEVNRLADPNRIEVGQSLWIPAKQDVGRNGVFPAMSLARLPRGSLLRWPVEGVLRSGFGPRNGRFHAGVDLAGPKGTPVVAAADGVVIFSGRGLNGYGNTVMIDHSGGLITLYAHNDRNVVREGERVRGGQVVALVGNSGRAWGTHLHFEVHKDGRLADPLLWLP